ncbi:hypothetical protein FACS1894120_3490 [Clostridia bacterium]|nr:hypothetical protein FACS1894120_3490 [Clostridia bacterium]
MIHVTDDEMLIIQDIIKEYAPDCDVLVYGSRYKGTHWKYSDLDLSFKGKKKLGLYRIGDIKEAFAESDLPYRVDVHDYNATADSFKAIIDSGCETIAHACG